jgi:hypothetical protein
MGYIWCFSWSGRIRGRILFKGVECNIPKKCWPKVDLRCVDEGKGCGPLDAKSEVIWGVVSFSHKTLGGHAFSFPPSLGRHPLFSPWLAAPSPPIAAALHCFLLPRFPPPPPRSKDREEEEHVELKRKRWSKRCSTPSLLADFLGETLGKDKIHVLPCNYVFLEVVDHGDWRIRGWIRCGVRFWSRN